MGRHDRRQALDEDGEARDEADHVAATQRSRLRPSPACGDPAAGRAQSSGGRPDHGRERRRPMSAAHPEGPSGREFTLRIHDEQDGMLWAEVEDLPGCFASGADMDELFEAAAEAIGMYLADSPSDG